MSTKRNWRSVDSVPGGAPAVGAFSPAAVYEGLVLLSGQVPQDPETGKLRGDLPFAEQVRLTLANLERVAVAAGSDLANLLFVQVFLQDIGNWAEFDQIYRETVPTPFPARAAVGADLAGFAIEIVATAVRKEGTRDR